MRFNLVLLVALAIATHLVAASYAAIAKLVVSHVGRVETGVLLYIICTLAVLAAALSFSRLRSKARSGFAAMTKRESALPLWGLTLAYSASALTYYAGLSGKNAWDFMLFTRLAHTMMAVCAVLVLREKVNRTQCSGIALALFGGFLVIFNAEQVGALSWAGLAYIGTSVVAHLFSKYSLDKKYLEDFGVLAIRTPVVLVVAAVVLGYITLSAGPEAATPPPAASDLPPLIMGSLLVTALLTAGALLFIFGGRFFALQRLPLWFYATLGSCQVVLYAVVKASASEQVNLFFIAGTACAILGEVVIFFSIQKEKVD